MDLSKIIHKVRPDYKDVKGKVARLQLAHPGMPATNLAKLYIKKVRNKYTTVGAVSALPGIIPGVGSIAQAAIEAGSFSADILLMLKWMGSVCYGTALIYGRDIEHNFDVEFASVLGIWSGVLTPQNAIANTNPALAAHHFDKHINDRIQNRVYQKIGKKLIAKYGSKKGGSAIGRFIPFGVGAVVGGGFNYFTMKNFGDIANSYFSSYGNTTYSETGL
jgi:hypothetical protein